MRILVTHEIEVKKRMANSGHSRILLSMLILFILLYYLYK